MTHRLAHHSRQAEWNLLWVVGSEPVLLETVSEIDVKDFAADPVHHDVGQVAVSEAEDVADCAVDGQRSREVGALLQPGFAV